MRTLASQLDEESLQALSHLSTCRIQTLMSESCRVVAGSSLLEVISLSIPLEDHRFVVIESDWRDTPKERLDYHCLSVRLAEAPKGFFFDRAPAKNGAPYRFDHLNVALGAIDRVAAIEILEAVQVGDEESVTYDAGLLVTRRNGAKFALVRTDSILGSMRLAHTPDDVEAVVANLVVRERIG